MTILGELYEHKTYSQNPDPGVLASYLNQNFPGASYHQAIRKDPAIMLKFNELSKRMNKNKAIICIARKLLNRLRYILLNQQPYVLGVVE